MPQPGTLNLIFHGLYVFTAQGTGLRVLAPRISFHSYLAGDWLGEDELASDSYSVRVPGRRTNTGLSFPPSDMITVAKDPATIDPGFIHHNINVPQPDQILLQQRARLRPSHFEVNTPGTNELSGDLLASVVVLVYRNVSNLNGVRLQGGKDLAPAVFTLNGSGSFANLHFWADSKDMEPLEEAQAAARTVYGRMLGSKKIPIEFPRPRTIDPCNGIAPAEYVPFDVRAKHFQQVLNQWRPDHASGADQVAGSLLLKAPASAVVSRTPTCGSLCVG
jgi:hypothetical protein